MGKGLHHENEAIAILEKELISWEVAISAWRESSKNEYKEAYSRAQIKIKDIKKALEILNNQ